MRRDSLYRSGRNLFLLAETWPGTTAFMRIRAKEGEISAETTSSGSVRVPDIGRLFLVSMVASEDPRFFFHGGFCWPAIRAALRYNLRNKTYARGGSSITQQLVKNLYLYPARSWTRKGVEAVLAVIAERALTKVRILEIYANVVEWGRGIWGCSQAASHYFNKNPIELTVAEIAFLCSLISGPLITGSRKRMTWLVRKQLRILARLYLAGEIHLEDWDVACREVPSITFEALWRNTGEDTYTKADLRRTLVALATVESSRTLEMLAKTIGKEDRALLPCRCVTWKGAM